MRTFSPTESNKTCSSSSSAAYVPDQRGVSNLGVLLLALIIGSFVYVGAQVFPYYYGYWELQAQFESMVEKAAIKKDSEIFDYLVDQMRVNGVNAERTDLKVKRQGKRISIDLEYTETLTLRLGDYWEKDVHVFEFNPYAEGEF